MIRALRLACHLNSLTGSEACSGRLPVELRADAPDKAWAIFSTCARALLTLGSLGFTFSATDRLAAWQNWQEHVFSRGSNIASQLAAARHLNTLSIADPVSTCSSRYCCLVPCSIRRWKPATATRPSSTNVRLHRYFAILKDEAHRMIAHTLVHP